MAVIAAFVLIMFIWVKNSFNNMVVINQAVQKEWAQVQTQYQRRAELINNLVSTVKGYADFEKSTLTQVIEARANATRVNISPDKLDEKSLQTFQNAQNQVSSALGRLMMITENYPNLKANENFLRLQDELVGTENRIANSRKLYNDAVNKNNTEIRKFPQVIFASMFGFKEAAFFEADQNAQKAPVVKF